MNINTLHKILSCWGGALLSTLLLSMGSAVAQPIKDIILNDAVVTDSRAIARARVAESCRAWQVPVMVRCLEKGSQGMAL